MPRFLPVTIAALAAMCIANCASKAQARKGPMIINHGDKVFEIAEAEEGSMAKLTFSDAVVGYHCQHFGVLWLPLWTWDGEFCVYSEEGESYKPLPPEEIAAVTGVPVEKIKKPFFYTFPLGLVILGVVVGLVIVAKVVGRGKNQTATAATQFTGTMPPGTAPPGTAPPGTGPPIGPPQGPSA